MISMAPYDGPTMISGSGKLSMDNKKQSQKNECTERKCQLNSVYQMFGCIVWAQLNTLLTLFVQLLDQATQKIKKKSAILEVALTFPL